MIRPYYAPGVQIVTKDGCTGALQGAQGGPGVQIVVKEGGAQCGTAGALGAPDAAHESKSFQKKGAQEPRSVHSAQGADHM